MEIGLGRKIGVSQNWITQNLSKHCIHSSMVVIIEDDMEEDGGDEEGEWIGIKDAGTDKGRWKERWS